MTIATTLSASVAAGDTSIQVVSADDWPQAQFYVAVNAERMLVQSGFGTTTWGVQRDQSAEAVTVIAEDHFDDREETGTLGMTTAGVDWKGDNSDASANVAVAGGVATIEILGASEQKSPILAIVDAANSEVRFRFMFDKIATGGDAYVAAWLRRQENANKDRYRLRALLEADGDMVIRSAFDGVSGATQIGSNVTKTGYLVVDTWYVLAFQAIGASPTTLNGKVWKEADGEPGWDVVGVTDSTAALQVAGQAVIQAASNAGVSNAPILFTFDDVVHSRAAEGRAHASGSAVALIEDWPIVIPTLSGVGPPLSTPGTGAQYIDESVEPPELWVRVGSAWRGPVVLT